MRTLILGTELGGEAGAVSIAVKLLEGGPSAAAIGMAMGKGHPRA